MFGFLKKKGQSVDLVGQEVHVNASATRAALRNVMRVERLKQAIAETKDSKRRAAMQQELAQRIAGR